MKKIKFTAFLFPTTLLRKKENKLYKPTAFHDYKMLHKYAQVLSRSFDIFPDLSTQYIKQNRKIFLR